MLQHIKNKMDHESLIILIGGLKKKKKEGVMTKRCIVSINLCTAI